MPGFDLLSIIPYITAAIAAYEGYFVITKTQPPIYPDPLNDLINGAVNTVDQIVSTGVVPVLPPPNPWPTLESCGNASDPNFRCCACRTRACPGATGCCSSCTAVCGPCPATSGYSHAKYNTRYAQFFRGR